jgi:hypothetical protein
MVSFGAAFFQTGMPIGFLQYYFIISYTKIPVCFALRKQVPFRKLRA